MIIVLSSRDELGALRKSLLDLRMHRNNLHEEIEKMNERINTVDEQTKRNMLIDIQDKQQKLDDILAQIQTKENEEDRLDPTRPARREREKNEIRLLGFTMVDHGEKQYNDRFNPPKDRTSLLKFLYDLGLPQKMPKNYRHHIIKLADNFYVAVEDYKVLTFRYDNWYYKKYGDTKKYDLIKKV